MTKVIEIKGIQFHNKGAELMLYTLHKWLQSVPTLNYQLVLPQRNSTPKDLIKFNALPKAGSLYKRIDWSMLSERLPSTFRSAVGCVSHSDVDVVLDASGFSYGSPWRPDMTLHSARQAEITFNKGGKYIVLPQAFGKFHSSSYQAAIKKLVQFSEIVFVRDNVSLENLREVRGLDTDKLVLTPDFTPYLKIRKNLNKPRILSIIPNAKMIDPRFNESDTSENYTGFLSSIVKAGIQGGYHVQLIDHGGKHDQAIIQKIKAMSGEQGASVIKGMDAYEVKRTIVNSDLVFSSRYHACISALSSNIPCFATSWSHKYELLYEYYGCGELLLKNYEVQQIKDYEELIEKSRSNIAKNSKKHTIETSSFFEYLAKVVL